LFSKGIKRGGAPLRISLPSPLHKGRGKKGKGLLNNLLLREGGQGDRSPNNLLIATLTKLPIRDRISPEETRRSKVKL